jgi:hypothetical protein
MIALLARQFFSSSCPVQSVFFTTMPPPLKGLTMRSDAFDRWQQTGNLFIFFLDLLGYTADNSSLDLGLTL